MIQHINHHLIIHIIWILYRRIEIINMQESQRHEESLPDHSDTQLESLSKQLWDSIQKAKWLYRSCKIGNYQDSQYVLTPSGVYISRIRMLFAPNTSVTSIIMNSFGRSTSKIRSTLHSSRIFRKKLEISRSRSKKYRYNASNIGYQLRISETLQN